MANPVVPCACPNDKMRPSRDAVSQVLSGGCESILLAPPRALSTGGLGKGHPVLMCPAQRAPAQGARVLCVSPTVFLPNWQFF